jgi:hypothetical protein
MTVRNIYKKIIIYRKRVQWVYEDDAPVQGGAAELGQIVVALQEGDQNKVEPRHVAVTLQQTNVTLSFI